MRIKILKVALGLAMALAVQRPAMAEIIYSTFGPANAFDRTLYKPVNFYTSPEIIGTSLAFAFEVPGSSDYKFVALSIAASWSGTKKNAQFALFADAGGLPAADPLEVVATNPDSLPRFIGDVISLTSPSQPILEAGQRYWVVCQPASLDASVPANDFVELWLNSEGLRGLETVRISFNSAPWEGWFDPAIEEKPVAFSIEALPVPEPRTPTLLMVASVVFLTHHFSRRFCCRTEHQ